MATKSKHKPVTLAKSPTDFTVSDVNVVAAQTSAEAGFEPVAALDEPKSSAKSAKASKPKTEHNHVGHDSSVLGDEIVSVYRGIADRSLEHARDAFSKTRIEAETFSAKLEESSNALLGGSSAVQSYVVKAMQTQADDLFGYFLALTEVKTVSDAIELQSTQSRRTLDASLRQMRDISALMNDTVVKAATPIRSALTLSKS